jgi:T4 RnlA family RNA ligase
MSYQLTYEDALRICEAYKNFNFYASEHMFGAYRVVTFNYFLCEYSWFVQPLPNEPTVHARDMRGVTFVFNEDGTLYKKFLMLEKFFNINQVEETQYDLIKNKKIKNISYKEDGSLIAFMQLPDGTVFAKTQAGFTNEQSIEAMKIYKSDGAINEFVNSSLNHDYTPLFEYVSFDNRIVLKYTKRELKFIGLRNNQTGEYYSSLRLSFPEKYSSIPRVKSMPIIFLHEIVEHMKNLEYVEGVVVEFEDGQLVKVKTNWYFNLHNIRTESIFREDYIIFNYLNETLDDVLSNLNSVDDEDAFKFVNEVKAAVMKWSSHIDSKVDELYDLYMNRYSKDWIAFASNQHRSKYFNLTKVRIQRQDLYSKEKVKYMLSKTSKLMEAKKIVEQFK